MANESVNFKEDRTWWSQRVTFNTVVGYIPRERNASHVDYQNKSILFATPTSTMSSFNSRHWRTLPWGRHEAIPAVEKKPFSTVCHDSHNRRLLNYCQKDASPGPLWSLWNVLPTWGSNITFLPLPQRSSVGDVFKTLSLQRTGLAVWSWLGVYNSEYCALVLRACHVKPYIQETQFGDSFCFNSTCNAPRLHPSDSNLLRKSHLSLCGLQYYPV